MTGLILVFAINFKSFELMNTVTSSFYTLMPLNCFKTAVYYFVVCSLF